MRRSSRAPVRIAHVVHGLHPGGTERRLLRLVEALDPSRHASTILCLDAHGELADEARSVGVEPVLVGRSGPGDLAVVARLARMLRDHRIDIVHGWLTLPSVVARLAAVPGGVPVRVAAEGGVRFTASRWRARAYGLADRALDPLTSAYVANSQAVADALRDRGIRPSKIEVVRNGVPVPAPLGDDERVALRRGLGARDGEVLAAMVARLDADFKDHGTFVRAVAALRDEGRPIRAAVVGDGPASAAIARLVGELDLGDRVVLTGFRPDASRLLGALDLSVLLSYSEGFSNVVLESMAAGAPLVATAISPNREALRDGVEGLLVPVGDLGATIEAMRRVVDDPGLGRRLGAAARARVSVEYSLEAQAKRTAELYDRLLAARPPR